MAVTTVTTQHTVTQPLPQFSTGLCDWCAAPGGAGRCCYTACCGPCAFGQNVERLSTTEVACCGGSCCGGCCLFYLLGGFIPTLTSVLLIPVPLSCSCFYHMSVRRAIREKYGIAGDGWQDCLTTCFCTPCAICQEARELDKHGALPIGSGVPQQTVVLMNMPPQPQVLMHPNQPVYVQPQALMPPPQQQQGYYPPVMEAKHV